MATAEINSQHQRMALVGKVTGLFLHETPKRIDKEHLNDIQRAIYACDMLEHIWHGLVEEISEDIHNGRDLYWMHSSLSEHLESAKHACQSLHKEAMELEKGGCVRFRDLSNVEFFLNEIRNIERWLDGWAPATSEFLDQVHDEITRGEFISREEFLREDACG